MKNIKTNISVEIDVDDNTVCGIYGVSTDIKLLIDIINNLSDKEELSLISGENLKDNSLNLILYRDDSIDEIDVDEYTLKVKMELLEKESAIRISSSKEEFNLLVSILEEGIEIAEDSILSLGIVFNNNIVSFLEPKNVKIYGCYSYISNVK